LSLQPDSLSSEPKTASVSPNSDADLETNQRGHVMPKFEFHFDLAAILLASALTAAGISGADAARKGGSAGGEFRAGTSAESRSMTGNPQGGSGGDVRDHGISRPAPASGPERRAEDWPPPPSRS
jgi:hypothetical protein